MLTFRLQLDCESIISVKKFITRYSGYNCGCTYVRTKKNHYSGGNSSSAFKWRALTITTESETELQTLEYRYHLFRYFYYLGTEVTQL